MQALFASPSSLKAPRAVDAPRRATAARATAGQDPLMLRVARGEEAERTPVWLMRQAGRYMAAFREYSEKYPFRMRAETPDIAIELSLQPWRAFGTDGVVFFSDILTPLPSLGIEFDMVKGKGPVIENPVRSMDDVRALKPCDDPAGKTGFVGETLSAIRGEIDGTGTTLIGFIGTPWTLAAYSVEGSANKECRKTKIMMNNNPEILHALLSHLANELIEYACYQIESGAQIIQLFDSWAHHLSPDQYREYSMPYSEKVTQGIRARHPEVPIILHANGGTGKLSIIDEASSADVLGLDWATSMAEARAAMPARALQGNVDPMVLFGTEDVIRREVARCLEEAGPNTGVGRHILNVGHGVPQGTPEENVGLFVQLAKESGSKATAGSERKAGLAAA
ncbi:unnamed protein product [Pedinophyceae sp. YPF-701]|nr:unnamed protein product [Pedinophyceae sp. YPF-701]